MRDEQLRAFMLGVIVVALVMLSGTWAVLRWGTRPVDPSARPKPGHHHAPSGHDAPAAHGPTGSPVQAAPSPSEAPSARRSSPAHGASDAHPGEAAPGADAWPVRPRHPRPHPTEDHH